MSEKEFRSDLMEAYVLKSSVKSDVYKNTEQTFKLLRKVLTNLEVKYTNLLNERVEIDLLPKYNKRGPFELEFKVAGDLLLINMHSNVFELPDNHPAWKTQYLKEDPMRSYCGMISIYNFLSDSFKYNRDDDLGYLITRIFINKDNHFMIEGVSENRFKGYDYESNVMSPGSLRKIIETAVQFCIEFDLFVPPYENVKTATVNQMKQKVSHSKIRTGKRLGFAFNTNNIKSSNNE